MKEIMNLINAWDPIGVFPLAPKDEYINEIRKIERYLHDNTSLNTEILSKRINDIFKKSFGDDVYIENMNACKVVAQKILEAYNNQ
ncbi:MAG: DUF1871 family protein [Lachnospiraceae bacterium]|nr:DUF1871 family protein [Lachnospiraceae bacterium]